MKKIYLLVATVLAIAGCKTSQPELKYDFSNVKSISTDGMEPSLSPNQIMKDTVITLPFHDPIKN